MSKQSSQPVHSNTGWFVVKIKPHGLDRAVTNLERQVYPPFMPKRHKIAQCADLMDDLFSRCAGEASRSGIEVLVKGTSVRVTAGPFASTLASVEETPEPNGAYVLFNIMGRSVWAIFPLQRLEVCS